MNALLDVTIGLVFLYLLLSLICTILNELVASFLGLRARNLEQGLAKLLESNGDALKQAFEATGIMTAARRVSGKHGPSYLAPENFTAAMIEAGKTAKNLKGPIKDVAELADCVESLPDSAVKSSLSAIVDGAGQEIDKAKEQIGAWFDSMMTRAAGNFNRKMKQVTLIFAVIVTVAFNADSLSVANALWTDSALRDQIADSAAAFVAEVEDVDELADLEVVQAELRPFPIGWDTSGAPPHSSDWYASRSGVINKIIGWLITALAVSLGAPFWFDLLKKLVALRGAGAAPKAQPAKPQG